MSTAEFTYVVATDPAYVATANEPQDALTSRVLLSNANHLADEFAQVRVAWSDLSGQASTATTPFTNLPLIAFRFPVNLRANGDAYRLRVRVGGIVASGTATFRVVVGMPSPVGALRSWGGAGDREFVTSALGTSSAWLTGTSQGPNASPDLLYVPSALITPAMFETTDVLSGNTTSVMVPMLQLTVYCTATASTPKVTAVYCAEVIST